MGLRLISDEELLTYDGEGYSIFYRRLPAHVRAGIVRRFTKRGTLDFYGASIAYLEYCIRDWKGVTRDEGKDGTPNERPVAFAPELVRYLPDEVQSDLIDLIGSPAERLEGEVENLKPTPDSKAKTAG